MKLKKLIITLCAVALFTINPICTAASPTAENNDKKECTACQDKEKARVLALTLEEYKALTEEQRKSLQTFYTILENIEFKNGKLSLNITEEQAAAKGLSKTDIDKIKASFEETNQGLEKMKQEGTPLADEPDFAKMAKLYRGYLAGQITLEEFRSKAMK